MSNLPYDAQIEYLESTGTQYINTGFTNTKSTEFVMDFQLTDATGDRKAIGQGFKFGLGQDSNKWRIVDSQWYKTSTDTDTFRHIAHTESGKYYIDSTQIADRYSQKTAGTYPMLLFAVSSQNSVAPDGNPAKMKLYSCKIYDDGVLVRDFIPVRVGQVGYLYDKVSETLFGNAGTGDFVLGGDRALPNPFGFRRRLMMPSGGDEEYPVGVIYYNNDSSIIFDGTVYIDTGIKLLSKDYDFNAVIQFKEKITSQRTMPNNSYFLSLGKFNAPSATGSIPTGIPGFFLKTNYSIWTNICASGTNVAYENNQGGSNCYRMGIYKRGNTYHYMRDTTQVWSITINGWAYTNDTLIFGAHRNINGTISNYIGSSTTTWTLDYCQIEIIEKT